MKNTLSADFCADQIDVITNFAVITVIKRVQCTLLKIFKGSADIFHSHYYNIYPVQQSLNLPSDLPILFAAF